MQSLKFSTANDQAKLRGIEEWIGYKPNVYSFSLPSGYSCPFAVDCLSKADQLNGSITDGKETQFRCFSATTESYFKGVRAQRWHNFDSLKRQDMDTMVNLIRESTPTKANLIRVHVGGDFFNQRYFEAWLQVARLTPSITFYAYTKSLPYWVANLGHIPDNFSLTASRGGRYDHLIEEYNLKNATVVFSVEQAEKLGLPIDHNEYYAINNAGNFALRLHGTQPKNSKASHAKKLNDRQGFTGYSRK